MDFKEVGPLIKERIAKTKEKEELEAKVKTLADELKELESKIKPYKEAAEAELNSDGKNEIKDDEFIAVWGVNISKGYNDEEAVLKYLKEHGLTQYIKVKEEIAKRDLNAELKINKSLNESLDPWTSTKTTKYLILTTIENYNKMQEHIEENK